MALTPNDTDAPRGPALLTALVALVASLAGIGNRLVADDQPLILQNPAIASLAHWRDWFTRPFWPPPYPPDLYRPLTSMLLTIENVIGGGSPVVFRLVSYILYVVAALAVWQLARRMMAPAFALAAALLFAAHPVHVEAVALAVGQSELAVAILAVAASIVYWRARANGDLSLRRWATLGAMYLGASLIKEQGVVLPAFLIIVELCLVDDERRRDRWRSLARGYIALAAIGGLVLLCRQRVLGDVAGSFVAEALIGLSFGGRVLTMLSVVPTWYRLLFWPAHLQADYSPGEIVASPVFGTGQLEGLLLLAMTAYVAWMARKRAPAVTFGILWGAIALAPVANIVTPTGIVVAERTLFLPSVGVMIAVGGALQWMLGASATAARILSPPIWTIVLAAFVVAAALRSAQRQTVWRSETVFIAYGVKDAPRSFRMQQAVGDLLFSANKPERARDAYAQALRLVPAPVAWRVHNSYAQALNTRGEREGEAAELRASLALNPKQQRTWARLIAADLKLGEYARAEAEADTAKTHTSNQAVFDRMRAIAVRAASQRMAPGTVDININISTDPTR